MIGSPSRSLVLSALAATAVIVALQIVLPRIFSVVLWYHLGFFAVSLAMLGGAAGSLFVARRAALDRIPEPALCLGAGSTALALAAIAALRVEVDPLSLGSDLATAARFVALSALLAIPFAVLGAALAAALALAKDQVPRIYGATFAGGALGALLGYYGMEWLGAPRTIGAAVGFGAALSLLLRFRGSSLAGIVLAFGIVAAPDALLPTRSTKHFPNVPPERILAERWNAASRVTFYENPDRHGLWDVAGRYQGPLPQSIGVAIDSWAITSILRFESDAERAFFGVYPPTLAFVGARPGFSALVIGAGGGVDVEAALHAGSGHVTAVEINGAIVDAVRGEFREFCGGIYDRPNVTPVVAEGRHFAELTAETYDRVVLTGVDTFASSQAGAFALSENHLYTVEAMKVWLERLAPDGRVTFTRWWYEPPRQTLRLVLTLDRVLRESGVADPRARIFVARTALNSVVVVKNSDFTPDEVGALVAGLPARGLALVAAPHRAGGDRRFADFLDPTGREAKIEAWPYEIAPSTDDWPFFFEYTRLDRLFATEGDRIHDRLGGLEFVVLALLSILLLSVPLAIAGVRGATAGSGRVLIACAFLGLGYVLVEAPLLSRLALVLGHPSKAITVVLVALLLGSGAGACVAGRIDPRRAAKVAFAAAIVVAGILGYGYPDLVEVARGESDPARVIAVLVYLAVPAFVLGMPFPLALKAAGATSRVIAGATVLNGVGSALAGPLAMLISLQLGFSATLLAAVGCYLIAGCVSLRRSPAA